MKNRTFFLFLTVFCLIMPSLYGQRIVLSPCYDSLLDQAKDSLNQGNYPIAFELFIAARNCWDIPLEDSLDYYTDLTKTRWTEALELSIDSLERSSIVKDRLNRQKEKALIQLEAYSLMNIAQRDSFKADALSLAYYTFQQIRQYNQDSVRQRFPEDQVAIPSVVQQGFAQFVQEQFGRSIPVHKGSVMDLGLSVGGDYLYSIGRDSIVNVYHWKDSLGGAPEWKASLKLDQQLFLVAGFSQDAKTLFAGTKDGSVFLWNWSTGEQDRFDGHQDAVVQGMFLNDGRLLTISRDGTARCWTNAQENRIVFSTESPLLDMQLSEDQQMALFRTTYQVFATSLVDKADQRGLFQHPDKLIYAADLTPDGQYALTVSSDSTLNYWSLYSMLPPTTIPLSARSQLALFLGAGPLSRFAMADPKGTLQLFSRSTAHLNVLDKIQLYPFRQILASRSGRYLLAVPLAVDQPLQLVQLKNSQGRDTLNQKILDRAETAISNFCFTEDERYLLIASIDGSTKLHPLNGALPATINLSNTYATHALFSAKQDQLILATHDGHLVSCPLSQAVLDQIDQERYILSPFQVPTQNKIDKIKQF